MSDITEDLLNPDVGTEPLIAYPWKSHADSLIRWARDKDSSHRAFAFDFLMSLAYVDTVPNLQKHFAHYEALPAPYGLHLGFINLCAPLYIQQNAWHYQKAAKPQSGAIGKLTSEVILRFIEILFPNLERVKVIGGVGTADAILTHRDGRIILCEVKASPLTTYPFLFSTPTGGRTTSLDKLSRTQVQRLDSALYLHCEDVIPLGKPKDDLWPFSAAIPFVTDPANSTMVDGFVQRWREIRDAYATKDRDSKYYYSRPPLKLDTRNSSRIRILPRRGTGVTCSLLGYDGSMLRMHLAILQKSQRMSLTGLQKSPSATPKRVPEWIEQTI